MAHSTRSGVSESMRRRKHSNPHGRLPAASDAARRKWIAVAVVLACLTPGRGLAQEPPPGPAGDSLQLVDQIVAIVGDTAILRSELYQEFFRMQSQGATLPPEGSEEWNRLALQVVSAAADRLLILQQAKRSDIVVSEEEVDAFAEQSFQQMRGNFNSDDEMQAAVEQSGMNLLQYRQMLRAEARAEILIRQFRGSLEASGQLPSVVVTEEEIVSYFNEAAASETRPATVSFNQLLIRPLPTPEARDSALAIADRALREIADGEDFAVVARRYSEDTATRDRGGELGWLRRGDARHRPQSGWRRTRRCERGESDRGCRRQPRAARARLR